ncbi:MAG: FkbM family methyltransferase [Pseudomonadota bacterium]
MGTHSHNQEPFGAYALPPTRERLRKRADRCANTRLGKWRISALRKRAIRGLSEPFDITVAPHLNARLYPSGNRCEKRALAGVQIWDSEERAALHSAVIESRDEFVFLDVGANAGLYTLFVNAYAKEAARPVRLIAVEPSQLMADRLAFNAEASEASVTLIKSAISDAPGQAFLSQGEQNLGETKLSTQGEAVTVETLFGLCERLGVNRIDAMKIDIEGHDEIALRAFFKDAPETLHPTLLIAEMGGSDDPIVELAQSHDYLVTNTTALNAILKKR